MRGNVSWILKEVTALSFCAVFTRRAGDGELHKKNKTTKNSLETQRKRMQIDCMYAKSGTLQRMLRHHKQRQICGGRERQLCVMEL